MSSAANQPASTASRACPAGHGRRGEPALRSTAAGPIIGAATSGRATGGSATSGTPAAVPAGAVSPGAVKPAGTVTPAGRAGGTPGAVAPPEEEPPPDAVPLRTVKFWRTVSVVRPETTSAVSVPDPDAVAAGTVTVARTDSPRVVTLPSACFSGVTRTFAFEPAGDRTAIRSRTFFTVPVVERTDTVADSVPPGDTVGAESASDSSARGAVGGGCGAGAGGRGAGGGDGAGGTDGTVGDGAGDSGGEVGVGSGAGLLVSGSRAGAGESPPEPEAGLSSATGSITGTAVVTTATTVAPSAIVHTVFRTATVATSSRALRLCEHCVSASTAFLRAPRF